MAGKMRGLKCVCVCVSANDGFRALVIFLGQPFSNGVKMFQWAARSSVNIALLSDEVCSLKRPDPGMLERLSNQMTAGKERTNMKAELMVGQIDKSFCTSGA